MNNILFAIFRCPEDSVPLQTHTRISFQNIWMLSRCQKYISSKMGPRHRPTYKGCVQSKARKIGKRLLQDTADPPVVWTTVGLCTCSSICEGYSRLCILPVPGTSLVLHLHQILMPNELFWKIHAFSICRGCGVSLQNHPVFSYTYPQITSVTQSCPTLFDPMNRSTPGLPVHHQLLELTETHVHRVSGAIQPSHPLSSPSPPAPSPSQHQSLFQ